MAMNMAGSSGGGGRRGRRKPVMAEINVTPMVDVMLVLLIIFMVAAPLLTVGVPVDLPKTPGQGARAGQATPLDAVGEETRAELRLQCRRLSRRYADRDRMSWCRRSRRSRKRGRRAESASTCAATRTSAITDMMKVLGPLWDAGYRASIVVVPEQGS